MVHASGDREHGALGRHDLLGKAAAPEHADAAAEIATPVQDEPLLEPLDPDPLAAAPAGVPDEA